MSEKNTYDPYEEGKEKAARALARIEELLIEIRDIWRSTVVSCDSAVEDSAEEVNKGEKSIENPQKTESFSTLNDLGTKRGFMGKLRHRKVGVKRVKVEHSIRLETQARRITKKPIVRKKELKHRILRSDKQECTKNFDRSNFSKFDKILRKKLQVNADPNRLLSPGSRRKISASS
jgi:hypothetical protein